MMVKIARLAISVLLFGIAGTQMAQAEPITTALVGIGLSTWFAGAVTYAATAATAFCFPDTRQPKRKVMK